MYSAFAAKREKLRFKQNVVETAVIYVACKEAGVPRTFRELARSTGLREKHIRKSYGLVRKVVVPKTDQAIAPTTAADLVVRATRHTTPMAHNTQHTTHTTHARHT